MVADVVKAPALLLLAAALVFPTPPLAGQGPRPPRIERLTSIGCDACGDAREFSEVADVALGRDDVIWVADVSAPRIRAFAPDGRPVRTFGMHGRGPGELASISRLFVDPLGVTAIDFTSQAAVRFDTAGRYTSTWRLGTFPLDVDVVRASGDLLLLGSKYTPGSSTVARLSAGAAPSAVLGPLADFPSAERPSMAHALAVAADGRIALTEAGEEYRIRVFAPDGTWRDIVRDLPRTKYTADEIDALKRRRARGDRLRSAETARSGGGTGGPGVASPLPTEKPHLRWGGLRFDPAGRLWVLTGRGSAKEAVIDLYDRELRLIGELRVPGVVGRFSVGEDRLVTTGEDDDGVPTVTLWRLVP